MATIELNRPQVANAIDVPMARELLAIARSIGQLRDVRVIVLRGAGKTFCGGGDMRAISSANDRPTALGELVSTLHQAILALHELETPIVGVVQGAVAGAGLSLMLTADIIMAAQSCRFLTAFERVGLSPDSGASWALPRRIGVGRALEFALLSKELSATDAKDWGLINQVAADDELEASASKIVQTLATGPVWVLGRTRHLIRTSFSSPLKGQLAREEESAAVAITLNPAQRKLNAFVPAQAGVVSRTIGSNTQ